MSYLWLLLKFVLTSDTCKCDKYGEKKNWEIRKGAKLTSSPRWPASSLKTVEHLVPALGKWIAIQKSID